MKTVLLIDGDQFIYKATAAVEKEIMWDEQNHVLYSNAEEAFENLSGMLGRILKRFDTRDHVLTFSASPNFRLKIDPTYKGNRVTRKPLCYVRLRERVEADYKCVSKPGLEADDVMGILATKPGTDKRIIVSQDKDMKTIPGLLWDGADLLTISEAEADYFHLYQTLIGDTSDGYKGCPGTGPKKAEKILPPIEAWPNATPWACVARAFIDAGLTEADALVQARLARILRWGDWDGKKQEPILWTAPK